jgi:hypothetical protein
VEAPPRIFDNSVGHFHRWGVTSAIIDIPVGGTCRLIVPNPAKLPRTPFERSRKRQAGARAVWVREGEPRPSTKDSRGSCVPEQCGPRKG